MGSKPKPPEIKPSEGEIALAEVGVANWNHYVNTFVPLENRFMEDATLKAGERQDARDRVSADVRQATAGAAEAVRDQGLAAGIEASSSASKLAMAGLGDDTDFAIGRGQAGVQASAETEQNKRNIDVIALGRNKGSSGVEGFATQAQNETRLALAEADARMKARLSRHNFWSEVGGTALGMGATKYASMNPDSTFAKNFELMKG